MKRYLTVLSAGLSTLILVGLAFGAGVVGAPLFRPTLQTAAVTAITPTTIPVQAVSETELKTATERARFLTSRYGVPESEVTALNKASYDVAGMLGLQTEGRAALHEIVLDFAEHGGTGLRRFGIEGDDLTVARAMGLQSAAALRAFVPQDIVRARALMATVGFLKYRIGT